jgi:hypothetical protein
MSIDMPSRGTCSRTASQRSSFDQERVERELDMLAIIHGEDMVTCRSVQRGVESRMIDEFRFTRLESDDRMVPRMGRAMCRPD